MEGLLEEVLFLYFYVAIVAYTTAIHYDKTSLIQRHFSTVCIENTV